MLPGSLFLRIARQICDGMNFIHMRGFIHRDLKPANVLLDAQLNVKIADLGLARAAQSSRPMTGGLMGTADFIAPEVLLCEVYGDDFSSPTTPPHKHGGGGGGRGGGGGGGGHVLPPPAVPGSEAPPASRALYSNKMDVYSFSIILFMLLTQRQPYDMQSPLTIAQAVAGGQRPELPASCPKKMVALIQECWAQNPKDRPSFGMILKKLQEPGLLLGVDETVGG
jgi:serine/threonine protein kinase